VAQKRANQWGLYDMHGNVREWVEDCYHKSYSGAPTDGSAWTSSSYRYENGKIPQVLRGCSCTGLPSCTRSAFRYAGSRGHTDDIIGFHISRTR